MVQKVSINEVVALSRFDNLPATSYVRLPVVRGLLGGVSAATVWRMVKVGTLKTHCFTSSDTALVTVEMRVGDISVPYISLRWLWISRTVMPREYSEIILSSKPVQRVWCLGISCGSKRPSRSRGISIGSSPNSPLSVFWLLPLRALPALLVTGSCLL